MTPLQKKHLEFMRGAEQCEYPRCACENKESCKQKAQPEQDNTYVYASSLATAIWQKHYMKESPKFALLDTTDGVLTQIDNMTCGLVREKPAQPEQEPVGKFAKFTDGIWREVTDGSAGVPLYTTPPQRTWVGLTEDDKVLIKHDANFNQFMTAGEYADRVQQLTEARLKDLNT